MMLGFIVVDEWFKFKKKKKRLYFKKLSIIIFFFEKCGILKMVKKN